MAVQLHKSTSAQRRLTIQQRKHIAQRKRSRLVSALNKAKVRNATWQNGAIELKHDLVNLCHKLSSSRMVSVATLTEDDDIFKVTEELESRVDDRLRELKQARKFQLRTLKEIHKQERAEQEQAHERLVADLRLSLNKTEGELKDVQACHTIRLIIDRDRSWQVQHREHPLQAELDLLKQSVKDLTQINKDMTHTDWELRANLPIALHFTERPTPGATCSLDYVCRSGQVNQGPRSDGGRERQKE
ncbi:hypothetical protein LTS08_008854 [Lithohypha guttulata]|nr:hypothetical protein LTS08_008854 [Lithohypha guttulata]